MAGFDVQHLGNSLEKAAVPSAHASRLAMRLHPDDEAVQQALQEVEQLRDGSNVAQAQLGQAQEHGRVLAKALDETKTAYTLSQQEF